MFLAHLTEREKMAFLALADAVIQADRHLAPQEETMLSAMRAEMAFPTDLKVPMMDVATAAGEFDGRPSRIAAMLELTGLSFADGDIHAEEEALLSRIGAAFGFTGDELLKQRDWVFRQLSLVHEAKVMMMVSA